MTPKNKSVQRMRLENLRQIARWPWVKWNWEPRITANQWVGRAMHIAVLTYAILYLFRERQLPTSRALLVIGAGVVLYVVLYAIDLFGPSVYERELRRKRRKEERLAR